MLVLPAFPDRTEHYMYDRGGHWLAMRNRHRDKAVGHFIHIVPDTDNIDVQAPGHLGCRRLWRLGPVRFAEKTSRNTVPANLVWEKNTVPTEKTSWKERIITQANRTLVARLFASILSTFFTLTTLSISSSLLAVALGLPLNIFDILSFFGCMCGSVIDQLR